MLLPRNAPAWLDRLSAWLEPFETSFGHAAQRGAFRRYLLGLLTDSRRKSMSAMLERVHDPGTYQAFQHFISHAPWDVARIWRQLRAVIPERNGVLIFDATSFPKQGTHSVGVARQYCGTLGKVANCQFAVTAALWTGMRAWMLGAALYVPPTWLTPEARQRAKIPATVRFQEKWRLALTLLRQARAAGFQITAVLGDADFGDSSTLRRHLHRSRLAYALRTSGFPVGESTATDRPQVQSFPTAWVRKSQRTCCSSRSFLDVARRGDRPPQQRSPQAGAPNGASVPYYPRRSRNDHALGVSSTLTVWRAGRARAESLRAIAAQLPRRAWRVVSWRNGHHRPWKAQFAAVRAVPAQRWPHRWAPEI